MQQIIRRRVVVEAEGRIQIKATGLQKGMEAEVLIIVEPEKSAREKVGIDLHDQIAAYAARHAGTAADLDVELEEAAVEFLNNQRRKRKS